MSNQNSTPAKKNAGYIIANDRANDRQPHYRGKVSVEGKEYLVSVWKKDPRDGKEMMSIELTDPSTLPSRATGQNASAQSTASQTGASASNKPVQQSPRPDTTPPPARHPASSSPPPPGEDKAFDDIFGGDGSQW